MSEENKVEQPSSTAVATRMIAGDSKGEWDAIKSQALLAFNSGMLPTSIKKPEQAAIIALKGRELGIPIMAALAGIAVINGKAVLSAELMLSLVYQRVPGARVTVTTPVEKQHEECEAVFQRPGRDPMPFRFTLDDARRAGLAEKQVWKQYPQSMLRARCISNGARVVFPDAIMGAYVEDEVTVEEIHAENPRHIKANLLNDRLNKEKQNA